MSLPASERGLLTTLARTLVGHPWKVALGFLLVSTLAGVVAWRGLGIETNRMALIGKQHRYNQVYATLQQEFGDVDAMIVVLKAPDRPTAKAAADALARAIEADPAHFPGLFYRIPDEALLGKALLFLELDDLRRIESRLRTGLGPAGALFHQGLGAFLDASARLIRDLIAGKADPKLKAEELAFLPPFVQGIEGALAGRRLSVVPWEGWIPSAAIQGRDGYVWTQDGRLVLLVQPVREGDLETEERSVLALRELLGKLPTQFPGVEAGLTGEPVLEVDELRTFRRDALVATIVSLIGVTLLFLIALRRILGPLLAMAATASAVLCTLGVATVWPGHLNLISLALCALMIGLGIDYAVHLISRYDEERARGLEGVEALRAALDGTGRAIAAGSLTTALAFLATLFSDVQGIREFGLIAGVGVVLSLLANLVLLPALVVLADRGAFGRRRRPHSAWPRSRTARTLDGLIERRAPWIVGLGALVAAGGLAFALVPREGGRGLRYDANLLGLQAQELESVRLAAEVLHDPGLSGMFAAIVVEDAETLRRVKTSVEALDSVSGTRSILDMVPGRQPEKLQVLALIPPLLEKIPKDAALPRYQKVGMARLASLAKGAAALEDALEEAARIALERGREADAKRVLALQERLASVAALAGETSDPKQRQLRAWRLVAHERALLKQLDRALRRLAQECRKTPITAGDLPKVLRDRYVGRTGKLLLRVYPAQDVWKPEHLRRFVTQLHGVVPDVGGVPVQFHYSDELMRSGFTRAGVVALLFVVFYLVVHFRSLLLPLVATTTLLVGASWAMGAMALLGIAVNPANLLALPLTFGIGIDYAIHVVHRDREARRIVSRVMGAPAVVATSSGRAVFLSSLTTVVGFGALTLSAHRGVASIGWTICLGVVGCLLSALLFCPALLRLFAGPSAPMPLEGIPGPKTGPGGRTIRPEPEGPAPEPEPES